MIAVGGFGLGDRRRVRHLKGDFMSTRLGRLSHRRGSRRFRRLGLFCVQVGRYARAGHRNPDPTILYEDAYSLHDFAVYDGLLKTDSQNRCRLILTRTMKEYPLDLLVFVFDPPSLGCHAANSENKNVATPCGNGLGPIAVDFRRCREREFEGFVSSFDDNPVYAPRLGSIGYIWACYTECK